MKLVRTILRARKWLLDRAAPPGTLRRRALHKGNYLLRAYLLHPLCARVGLIPKMTRPLDVYNPDALNACFAQCEGAPLTWAPRDAEKDDLGAARVALSLLQRRPDLRERFPQAVTDGPEGGYCRWLCAVGFRELGLSPRAADHFRAAFDRHLSHRLWQLFNHNTHFAGCLPLALTPAGQRQLVRWCLPAGKADYGLLDEEIWWFLFERAEDPHQGIALTYLRNPHWQERFPHGLTVFGQRQLLGWIARHYNIRQDWLRRVDLSGFHHPVDELRLLYQATPALQKLAPAAFRDPADTERLIGWLRAEGSGLAPLAADWWARFDAGLAEGLLDRPAVNVFGHFCYPSGLREAVQASVRALHSAGVRTSCRDVPASFINDQPGRNHYLGLELYDRTLVNLAPEPLVEICYPLSGLAARSGVYRIAVWYWELEEVPPEWARHARTIQEIWAPTTFIARAMRRVMPIPVVDMLPGVRLGEVPSLPRSHFGLPGDSYLFLFMFDMCSVMERKNPLAVIRAFQQAFGPDDRAALVLKVSHGDFDKENLAVLAHAAAEAGVMLIDRVMSREESYALMNACDAYVSLHRSEGLGLTMAEAMLMAKPVIATGYSGNLDFMTRDNSLLVDYTRVPITQTLQFYRKGCVWAEPSITQAAHWMRWLYDHPRHGRSLGERARRDVSRLLSLEAAGRRMARRLEELQGNGQGSPGTLAA